MKLKIEVTKEEYDALKDVWDTEDPEKKLEQDIRQITQGYFKKEVEINWNKLSLEEKKKLVIK